MDENPSGFETLSKDTALEMGRSRAICAARASGRANYYSATKRAFQNLGASRP